MVVVYEKGTSGKRGGEGSGDLSGGQGVIRWPTLRPTFVWTQVSRGRRMTVSGLWVLFCRGYVYLSRSCLCPSSFRRPHPSLDILERVPVTDPERLLLVRPRVRFTAGPG